MRKPEAVIFDMDGVLVDSEPIHVEIEKKLFDNLGIDVADVVHRSYMGASNEFMYLDLKTRFNLQESIGELIEHDEVFRCDYLKHTTVIKINEGVISLLGEIKTAGLKLAVATSSSPAIALIILNRCEILSYFDTIITTSEAGKSKPSPDVYLLAAQRIGVAPANCIVFEDSPNGLLAAKSAGMYCVAIQPDGEFNQALSEADYQIRTFREMTLNRLFEIFSFNQDVVKPTN
ncbi:MAG: HAD family phosphatase [Bacteroidia bacterium]|nr:HAD family phosphatase [Bacteroidia bacterium]